METKHLYDSIKEFGHVAIDQEYKGLEKYGQPLNPLDNYDWLGMAKQESADEFKYLHAEQVKRTFIVNKIRKLSKGNSEIEFWLDELEGKNRGERDDKRTHRSTTR